LSRLKLSFVRFFTIYLPYPGNIKTSQNVYFTNILIIESANITDITMIKACFISAAGSSGAMFFSRKS
jgi:hypothetical protein